MAKDIRGYDEAYLEFVDHFNRGAYEAGRETLVELWLGNPTNNFYKGLIQLAGACDHWASGSYFWAEDLFASAHNLLAPYAPKYQGIEITPLLKQVRACNEAAQRQREASADEEAPPLPPIRLELVGQDG